MYASASRPVFPDDPDNAKLFLFAVYIVLGKIGLNKSKDLFQGFSDGHADGHRLGGASGLTDPAADAGFGHHRGLPQRFAGFVRFYAHHIVNSLLRHGTDLFTYQTVDLVLEHHTDLLVDPGYTDRGGLLLHEGLQGDRPVRTDLLTHLAEVVAAVWPELEVGRVEAGESVLDSGDLDDLVGAGTHALQAAQAVLHEACLIHHSGRAQQSGDPAAQKPDSRQQAAHGETGDQLHTVLEKASSGGGGRLRGASAVSGSRGCRGRDGITCLFSGPLEVVAKSLCGALGFVVEADDALVGHYVPLPVIRCICRAALAAAAVAARADAKAEQGNTGQQAVEGTERAEICAPQAAGKEGKQQEQPQKHEAHSSGRGDADDPNVWMEKLQHWSLGEYGDQNRTQQEQRHRIADQQFSSRVPPVSYTHLTLPTN